jgi:hypothetical protein
MKTLKTTMLISNLVLMFLITFFTSCEKPAPSTDVNQSKIHGEYELFYDANTDKTYASAVFKFNSRTGTALQLVSPSEIKFNNDQIPFDAVLGYYRKEYAGKILAGSFNFKDGTGVNYANSVNLSKVADCMNITTISRTGSFNYTWIGDNLGTNEALSLVIVNVTNPLNFQYFIQNSVGATNLVLPLNQLNQLPVGNANCYLDRQIESNALNVTAAGGIIRGKYRCLIKPIIVN